MGSPSPPEAWLRGPLPDIAPALMPAAHALVQAREDIAAAMAGADESDLWVRPGGAASAGFHLRHLTGSLDRLLTYARGERLTPDQLAALRREGEPGEETIGELTAAATAAIGRALDQLRQTPAAALGESRPVGRAALPATVLGLLAHASEHTARHTGQLITTLKVVRGLRATPAP
jgi:uncharacterized damage-inducible protein DinB